MAHETLKSLAGDLPGKPGESEISCILGPPGSPERKRILFLFRNTLWKIAHSLPLWPKRARNNNEGIRCWLVRGEQLAPGTQPPTRLDAHAHLKDAGLGRQDSYLGRCDPPPVFVPEKRPSQGSRRPAAPYDLTRQAERGRLRA
ncbi:MAG: hypothetical protein BJ554DRAFT_3182 [Olpidium bornovanus]|uniref:Uncharacterized protein n=1 Tax=Olpidium bornovanus TaxID=278681 RepID=A0A8H8DLL0_9FUNG|nr:MAG: hypothetical protein BJ554DRAFT_3182 [Olpidium bornovanus]